MSEEISNTLETWRAASQRPRRKKASPRTRLGEGWHWYHLLPLVAIASFMFTPLLTWRLGVPGAIRWVGDLAVAAMVLLAIVRMLSIDRVPGAFLAILAISIIGFLVAVFEGQHIGATLWGWWTAFRYPIVGLYIYLVPDWPKKSATLLLQASLGLLALQVFIQVVQFVTGTLPGDHLSGTLGRYGTAPLILFIMFVMALALGRWLAESNWRMLAATFALGAVSSSLGEMKLFAIGTPVMAAIALILHLLRRGQIRRILYFLVFLAIAVAGFVGLYNWIVSDIAGRPRLETVLFEEERREQYLGFVRDAEGGTVRLGRALGTAHSWQMIQRDGPTLLFGMGLGTGQISTTFGLSGAAYGQGNYGTVLGGTSLQVFLQETGLVGMATLGMFVVLTAVILFRAARVALEPPMDAVRYGVLLYTLMWPLWLWYSFAWVLSASAVLYWVTWGFVMKYSVGEQAHWLQHEVLGDTPALSSVKSNGRQP